MGNVAARAVRCWGGGEIGTTIEATLEAGSNATGREPDAGNGTGKMAEALAEAPGMEETTGRWTLGMPTTGGVIFGSMAVREDKSAAEATVGLGRVPFATTAAWVATFNPVPLARSTEEDAVKEPALGGILAGE